MKCWNKKRRKNSEKFEGKKSQRLKEVNTRSESIDKNGKE